MTFAVGLAETRAAHASQGFLLDVAQQKEEILPGFALDDLLANLKRRHALAVLESLQLAHAFVAFEHHAATLKHLRKLRVQFHAQELDDRQAGEKVDRNLVFGLGAIQCADMQFRDHAFEVRRLEFLAGLQNVGQLVKKWRSGSRGRRFCRQKSFDVAMASDQARNVCARGLGELGTEMNIVPKVIDADLQAPERE